jgi:hypothetical protein
MPVSAPHSTSGAGAGRASAHRSSATQSALRSNALVVALLTVAGGALRLVTARQSLFGDELSTYFIVSTHGLGGVIAAVKDEFEITPPLSFVMAWLSTRAGVTTELLRAPSVLAGTAAIPLVYAIGARTVGRRAGMVAAALTALAPFMIFYSSEARAYQLAIVLVLLSTLAMLTAVRDRRSGWWVAYGACSCAACYTHYTSAFALAAQGLWVLWAHPEARKAAILANVGALVAFLPWLDGLRNDLASPDTKVWSLLSPFTAHAVRLSIEHWAVGYPYAFPTTELRDLPGIAGLSAEALGLALGAVGLALALVRTRPRRVDPGVALVIVMTLSAPVAEAVVSALGTNMLTQPRNLAVAWPWFALSLAAVLVSGARRLAVAAAGLVLVGFVIGAAQMLGKDFRRPDFKAAARFIDREASPTEYVIDGAVAFLAPGPVTGLDAALDRAHPILRAGAPQQRDRNFSARDAVLTNEEVVRRAGAATGRRMFILATEGESDPSGPAWDELVGAPARYRRVETRSFAGAIRLVVHVYEKR